MLVAVGWSGCCVLVLESREAETHEFTGVSGVTCLFLQ